MVKLWALSDDISRGQPLIITKGLNPYTLFFFQGTWTPNTQKGKNSRGERGNNSKNSPYPLLFLVNLPRGSIIQITCEPVIPLLFPILGTQNHLFSNSYILLTKTLKIINNAFTHPGILPEPRKTIRSQSSLSESLRANWTSISCRPSGAQGWSQGCGAKLPLTNVWNIGIILSLQQ